MVLDDDLMRDILIKVEKCGPIDGGLSPDFHPDYSEEQVCYHAEKMKEAGLIRAVEYNLRNLTIVRPTDLTWSGHQFVRLAKSDSLWTKAKRYALEKTGAINFEILKIALKKLPEELL